MPDDKKECKNESTKPVNVQADDRNSICLDSKEEGQLTKTLHNTDESRIDQMIEDLFQRLFGENLIGETFVDQDINEYLNEFMIQMQYEKEFQFK